MAKSSYTRAIEIVKRVLKSYDYVMIGAQGVNAWVVDEDKIRATRDIDFLLDAPEDIAMDICQKFRDAGYTAHLRMGKKSDEIPLYIRLTSEIYPQIDIIFALKIIAGSDRDFIDIKNLIADRQTDINLKAVKKRILEIDEKLLKRLKLLNL